MPQSDFMSLQPWIKHINNMVNSLNISHKCCGKQVFCQWRRLFPSCQSWFKAAWFKLGMCRPGLPGGPSYGLCPCGYSRQNFSEFTPSSINTPFQNVKTFEWFCCLLYDLPLKLLFPLRLPLQFPFSPISLLARTAYMLRKSSQLIRMLIMFMHLPTLWFLRKILTCMLQIFLPPLSWFRSAKYLERDTTQISGLTTWENTPLRTSRKFMHTLK